MKIQVRTIREEGLDLLEEQPVEWTGLTRKDNLRFVEPVKIKAHAYRAQDELIVNVGASSIYESYCHRCLDDIKKDWSAAFTLVFDIDRHTDFVKADEDIRQEIILNLPERVLCKDDCKGLCVECGVNLNNSHCEHVHLVVSGQ